MHLHGNLYDESFRVHGGHVDEMHILATYELLLRMLDGEIGRRFSEQSALNLIAFQ